MLPIGKHRNQSHSRWKRSKPHHYKRIHDQRSSYHQSEKDIHEAGRIIGEQGYRRAPVVDGGRLLGIISIADLAEQAMSCKPCVQDIPREVKKSRKIASAWH
ncbi:MAG: CBS domain-containing protein [Methanotrichaceae archaeon]|nr:CBS domain-containing protein [Methanotrichaceae archaeon]